MKGTWVLKWYGHIDAVVFVFSLVYVSNCLFLSSPFRRKRLECRFRFSLLDQSTNASTSFSFGCACNCCHQFCLKSAKDIISLSLRMTLWGYFHPETKEWHWKILHTNEELLHELQMVSSFLLLIWLLGWKPVTNLMTVVSFLKFLVLVTETSHGTISKNLLISVKHCNKILGFLRPMRTFPT